jgi:hypothetical protein
MPVGHCVVGVEDGVIVLGVDVCGMGLRPPTPSSVEPKGTPRRPTPDGAAIPVGDDDVAGAAMPGQVPDAVPAIPPPSKSPVEPVLGETPDKLPAIESMREHVEMELPVAGLAGDIPEVVGLSPNDPCSVAPSGTPVRGTAGAAPIPSGDVMPSGDGPLPPPTCAYAEPHPRKTAVTAAISNRFILTSSSFCIAAATMQVAGGRTLCGR